MTSHKLGEAGGEFFSKQPRALFLHGTYFHSFAIRSGAYVNSSHRSSYMQVLGDGSNSIKRPYSRREKRTLILQQMLEMLMLRTGSWHFRKICSWRYSSSVIAPYVRCKYRKAGSANNEPTHRPEGRTSLVYKREFGGYIGSAIIAAKDQAPNTKYYATKILTITNDSKCQHIMRQGNASQRYFQS